ncbi:MAG: caspase family protein [Streptosporangiaceae bacterium]
MSDSGPDLGRSRAVLIGTGGYTDLPPVPAALASLRRMESLLAGSLCGWPKTSLTVLRDLASPSGLPDRLVQTFSEAEDVALFYFVGHGLVDLRDSLCLTLRGSRNSAKHRRTTSLLFDDVRYAIQESPARSKIVILDCCYAGRAAESTLGADGVRDLVRGTGAITLAASGEFGRAWYQTAEEATDPQTCFTRYFVDVVEAGIAEESDRLRLGSIFNRVVERCGQESRPLPVKLVADDVTEFPFARNVAASVTPTTVPEAGPRLPDPRRSRALLVGVSRYDDAGLAPLPSAVEGTRDLAGVLTDPALGGWPRERVTVLEDPAGSREVASELRRLAAEADDVLLVYFSGRALLADGRLCLALTDTGTDDDADLTSLEYERVIRILRTSPAHTKIVILDCEHSAGAGSESTSLLLTASDRPSPPFTADLVRIIRAGVPGAPNRVTLNQLHTELRRRCAARGDPPPLRRGTDAADASAFTRNTAVPGGPAPLVPAPRAQWPSRHRWQALVAASAAILMIATGTAYALLDSDDGPICDLRSDRKAIVEPTLLAATPLTFCPVRINHGVLPLTGRSFDLEGQVLGPLAPREQLILVNSNDLGTCDALGNPAVRGTFIKSQVTLTSASGRWFYTDNLGYDEAITVGRTYRYLTASTASLNIMRDDFPKAVREGRDEKYSGMLALPSDARTVAEFHIAPGRYEGKTATCPTGAERRP